MTETDAVRELAARIARDLFTNGGGQRAERLRLVLENGRDGGGWAETAAADRIARTLAEAAPLTLAKPPGAYCQSDEISVLLTDFDTIQTDAWFGYRVQKMASVAASIATAYFTGAFRLAFPERKYAVPMFDARVFSVPVDEVANYFVWRQKDAVRNSIQATGQAHFSAKQLHGVSCDQIQEKLFTEKGVNWSDTPIHHKRGFCVTADGYDWTIPVFTADRDYIESRIPNEADSPTPNAEVSAP